MRHSNVAHIVVTKWHVVLAVWLPRTLNKPNGGRKGGMASAGTVRPASRERIRPVGGVVNAKRRDPWRHVHIGCGDMHERNHTCKRHLFREHRGGSPRALLGAHQALQVPSLQHSRIAAGRRRIHCTRH
eukprot:354591-Chlamydomonas_euryale.AAC.4